MSDTHRRDVTSVLLSRNVSRFGNEIIETIPATRQQYSYVYVYRSFTGTTRALTIRRQGVNFARGGIPGEDLLPAQDASFNALL